MLPADPDVKRLEQDKGRKGGCSGLMCIAYLGWTFSAHDTVERLLAKAVLVASGSWELAGVILGDRRPSETPNAEHIAGVGASSLRYSV